MPLYDEVEILAVGIDEDAQILAPCPFSVPKLVVFYGTSITQGGCASRPGLSYQGIACRQLNLDYMNFGFSGRGKCELVLAQALAQIDAACYVLDVGSNNKPPEEFHQRFHPFLEHLVNERPNVPVLIMMPSWFNAELWSEKELDENNHRRETVRETVEYWQNREAIVSILERKDCIGEAFSECTVDGKHPNEFGFAQIAKNLIPALSQILEL